MAAHIHNKLIAHTTATTTAAKNTWLHGAKP
jgi:hypothetical protein